MSLATVTWEGMPASRMVMLRGLDERGFVFYTSMDSPKGDELAHNPQAALLFFWARLGRQVRLAGRASKLPASECEAVFRQLSPENQLESYALQQSQPVAHREFLVARYRALAAEFEAGEVAGSAKPMPAFWGGYRVKPEMIEFWQIGQQRLHNRFRYRRQGDNWHIERLSP